MDGDEIQKAFEAKHEKFLAKTLKTVESAPATAMTREMKDRQSFEDDQRRKEIVEGAPFSANFASVSAVLRPGEVPAGYPKPLEERVDSLARNVVPLNGKETKVTRSPLEEGLDALEKMGVRLKVPAVGSVPSPDELEIRFKFHAADAAKAERHRDVRQKCYALAEFLCKECPASRELSIALTKVEEVMLWANAAIARRG